MNHLHFLGYASKYRFPGSAAKGASLSFGPHTWIYHARSNTKARALRQSFRSIQGIFGGMDFTSTTSIESLRNWLAFQNQIMQISIFLGDSAQLSLIHSRISGWRGCWINLRPSRHRSKAFWWDMMSRTIFESDISEVISGHQHSDICIFSSNFRKSLCDPPKSGSELETPMF